MEMLMSWQLAMCPHTAEWILIALSEPDPKPSEVNKQASF